MATLDEIINPQPVTYLTEDYVPSSVACTFETGPAGCGKTWNQLRRIEENPLYGTLVATTGIAAINLGAQTINSTLKYFDTDSLRDLHDRGRLASTLAKIGKFSKRLVVDEVSMMDGRQLDYIYDSMIQANRYKHMEETGPMGIVLTGDFAQLPPVNAPWAFEADCWEHFERGTTVLSKIYRQTNPEFMEALRAARAGDGPTAAKILSDLNVKFIPTSVGKFDGTTIISKNPQVDAFNFSALINVPGQAYALPSAKWGTTASEWKNIPDQLKLKDNAYVMILANSPAQTEEEFRYANGDTGHVVEKDVDGVIHVKLTRNGRVVPIGPIVRHKTERDPFGSKDWKHDEVEHIYCNPMDCGMDMPGKKTGEWGKVTYNCQYDTWNVGAIKYYPLRLAYATSVHKSQGLTLDIAQIDIRDGFFGKPGMAYVALSRCRTPEGLTIVGDPVMLAQRIKADPKVKRWL